MAYPPEWLKERRANASILDEIIPGLAMMIFGVAGLLFIFWFISWLIPYAAQFTDCMDATGALWHCMRERWIVG